MSILIYRDRATACTAAATLLSAGIIENPRCTLGLDCDRDLDPVYRTLAQMTGDGLLDWSDVKTFNLFEHVRADESKSAESRLGSILLDAAGATVASDSEVSLSGTSAVFSVGNSTAGTTNGQVRFTKIVVVVK